MKRQTQETGVRTYFGEDLIGLQSEPLKALDAFFRQYGPCIIQGCEITANADDTVNIAAGLVALDTADRGVIVMPFGGASGVVFPLYMFPRAETVERLYDDGDVKPVAYDYTAQVSALPLTDGTPSLTLSGIDGLRFVDAVQDPAHRFISDAERAKWNDILRLAKEYADATADTALRASKDYTDAREAVLTNLIAQKLDTVNYTAADVKEKLLTVDGYGSQLVSDFIADRRDATALGFWTGTQGEYDAIPIKDPRTLYIIQ